MIKKLILVLFTSILFLTGCQSIKGVNFDKMILNNSNIQSAEGKTTVSLHLTYNKAQVQDKDLLKMLDLFNHLKLEIQTKMQNANTISMEGNVVLQAGKIPFQLYMDKKEVVLLIDTANKPIRIPIDNGASQNEKWVQDFQAKVFASIVKNLPNPKHISVQTKSEKVHGEVITGYKVHAEIYANEAPELLLSFINNVSRDEKAIVQIVNAINELNAATGKTSNMTIAEFKDGLQQFKTEFAQSLPELKNVKLLSSKNYFKTDIFLDRNFYERKSSTDLNIVNIEDGSGLKGIRLLVDNETWNINEPVTAKKIRYSSYLTENATMEEFLATLDKKRSVLYKVLLKLAN